MWPEWHKDPVTKLLDMVRSLTSMASCTYKFSEETDSVRFSICIKLMIGELRTAKVKTMAAAVCLNRAILTAI